MKVWKIVKKTLAFFGTRPFLRISSGLDARQRVLGEGREGVVGLVGQDVAVGEEQDARPARRLAASRFQRLWNSFQAIWKAMEVLPVPVASVSRMRLLAGGDGLQRVLDGVVLVVARLPRAALVLERDGGEAVAPGVRLGEDRGPELVRRRDSARHSASAPVSMSIW